MAVQSLHYFVGGCISAFADQLPDLFPANVCQIGMSLRLAGAGTIQSKLDVFFCGFDPVKGFAWDSVR